MNVSSTPMPTRFDLVCCRLADFFGHGVAWHRGLWSIGTVLAVEEVLEYAEACLTGRSPSIQGLRFVINSVKREVGRDPGVAHLAGELREVLDRLDTGSERKASPGGVDRNAFDQVGQLARRARADYWNRWSEVPADVPVELAARAIASHLLDAGLSSTHLYRWLQAKRSSWSTLVEFVEEAVAMEAEMPPRRYRVFIPCVTAPYGKPPPDESSPVRWLDGRAASEWLRTKLSVRETRRHGGGFLVVVERRDAWAAVDAARSVIARADARARVARQHGEGITMSGWARVEGSDRDFDMHRRYNNVKIASLDRNQVVYRFDGGLPLATDNALELASYMKSPLAGEAIIGGWSAIEALLIRPGERNKHKAADRLAALVACSLPRAELTHLAYKHAQAADDTLACRLRAAATNHDKVALVERHLKSGSRLTLTDGSDIAAENRVIDISGDPAAYLERIRRYVMESLRRLYNQRNLIAHSGSFESAVLTATVRTSLGLVGAGLDRIVHAQLRAHDLVAPLQLAARAETELRLLGTPGGRSPISLLD